MGVIYVITNTVNGRKYVGQTTATLPRRWSEHRSDARNHRWQCILHNALRKYGPEAFTIEAVDSAESKEELDRKEQEWIARLGTTDPKIGYNCTSGGGACIHGPNSRARQKGISHWTPEAKAKRIATMRALGKFELSPERREALRLTRVGYKNSPESRQKMSQSHRARWTPEMRETWGEKQRQIAAERKARTSGEKNLKISASSRRMWEKWRETGEVEAILQRRSESQKKIWGAAERRQQERDKWTPEMRAETSAAGKVFYASFAGVVALVKRSRAIRERRGKPHPVVRLLEVCRG